MTLTSESTPPYLWHKPQKSAETQSFSPLISNIQQGNNDFVYVSALEKILNSPLTDSRNDSDAPDLISGVYQITNAAELLWFANYVNAGNPGANAKLCADIVLNENLLSKIGNGETENLVTWIPIGTAEYPYKGEFKTDTFAISGLYVNNPEQDYVGLFGYYAPENSNTIYYLSVKDSYFAGRDYVGGLLGYVNSENASISSYYFRGEVSGNNYVGGLFGKVEVSSGFYQGYVSAEVTGCDNVGSICGYLDDNSSISNCYYAPRLCSIGAINGNDDTENDVVGSYTFQTGELAYLIGFRQDLSDPSSFPEFKGKHVHKNLDGSGYHNPEYEDHRCIYCLNYTYELPQLVDGVYQISNADELYGFMHIVNSGNTHANAVLTADIVVNENVLEKVHAGDTEDLREWYSIGDNGEWGFHSINGCFAGIFDGNFHTISGLYFDSQIGGNVQCGFISILNGIVRNVIITDSYFHYSLVGGIVCYLMDKEYDEKYGKVINDNTYPAIENCIFDGEIIGEQSAAGICRTFNVNNDGDYIKNCINYGKIIGAGTQSGGILGASWDYGSVVNCYNAGELVCTDESAGDSFGGICGGAALAGISNCYNTGSVSFGYGVYGDHWKQCNITNTYNNSDICKLPLTTSDTWANNITGGGNTTTADLCNGKLPEGFSEEDWIAGKTETTEDGIVYTFPHLKVFDGQYPAYSIIKDPREPYALLSDNGETVTFYYDKNKPEGAYELQPSYYFNTPWLGGDYETIVFDESFKNYKPTSTAYWFYGLFNLKEIKGLENLNTEKVTDMQYMFHSCCNIESLDLSGFDVSNVTNMTAMFRWCDNLHTIFVGDNWNFSDYLSSNNMFEGCYSLYGEQGSMPESYKVYDASMAKIDGGDNTPGYFTKKGNSKATVTSIDFAVNPYSEHTLGEPINRQSGILNVNFNNREAQQLPYNCFNITPSGYDSTKVGKQIVTVKLLNATTTYEVNVTAKDTSYAYLDDNGVLTLYYGEYKQGAIFGSNNRFNNPGTVKKVIIDKSFANYHPTTCAFWFEYFNNMTEIKGLENLNTQYVMFMDYMFNGCSSLTTLDVSNFNTEKVSDMGGMFGSCSSLTTLDVSNFKTEIVSNMTNMFSGCSSLTTLDVSNFNTDNVMYMSSMFGGCSNLQTIYVGDNWTTKNVTESVYMFNGCNNLYGGKGTIYDENFIDATYARIDDGAVAPGYFTLKINNPYTKPEIKDDFYQIGNVEELLWFVFDVNNGDTKANAQLTNDIVVNKDCMERITKLLGISKAADDLTVWQPIGTLNNAYAGIFDGQGHYISGIYINNKNEENVGLFGVTSTDAVIKNIGITDSYIAAKENVGAIVGNNNGIVANCYSTATIESQPNAQNVNGIAGKVSENAVVANSYYLTSEANTNDPQAKTLAEFKSGEVAQLLAEGATINGEKFGGESFAGIVDLPGTENLEELTTPTSELTINSNIRIWSFENTIFVENSCNKIEIVDMAGRVVKQVAPNSNRTEISLPNSGVYIVKTGVKTQKVIVR